MRAQQTSLSSIAASLSGYLTQRCQDRSIKWAYHPQSNGVGQSVAQQTLVELVSRNGLVGRALKTGRLAATFNAKISGKRRAKTVDLAIGSPTNRCGANDLRPGELLSGPLETPLLIVEVKCCMTAHQKARTRLVSELLSTLEVADGLIPRPTLLGFIVMNYSERFTSPKNLPGPNRHDEGDAERALAQIFSAVPSIAPSGYDALVVVPITFDNETVCKVAATNASTFGTPEGEALALVDRRVGRAAKSIS